MRDPVVAATAEHRPAMDVTLIVAQFYLIGMLAVGAVAYFAAAMPPEPWIFWACAAHVVSAVWMAGSWMVRTGGLFDPYGMFLVTAIVFNGGHLFLEVLHLNDSNILYERLPADVVLKTIFFVTLGLTCMHLGALLAGRRQLFLHQPAFPTDDELSYESVRNTRVVGWVLVAVALFPAMLEMRQALIVVWVHGYAALYYREFALGVMSAPRVIGAFIVPGTLFLLAGSRGKGLSAWTAIVVLVLYSVSFYFLGYRAYPSMALIAAAWLWHRTVHPLPVVRSLAVGLAVVVLLFPLIAAVRTTPGEQRISPEALFEVLWQMDNPLVTLVRELGGTMWTVAYTIAFVPDVRPFDYGASYVYAGLRILPNLFWSGVHPAVGRAPSEWLLGMVNPLAGQAEGLGYSFLAEAYLNFGWVGGPLFLLLLGVGVGRLSIGFRGGDDVARMALAASVLAIYLLYARADTAGVIRALSWYALGPYFVVRVFTLLRPRGEVRAAPLGAEPATWK